MVAHGALRAALTAQPPDTITGTGEDELAAMTELCIQLDERRRADKLEAIERRGRGAFLDGDEAQSRAKESALARRRSPSKPRNKHFGTTPVRTAQPG
jgi:hypothetical protein